MVTTDTHIQCSSGVVYCYSFRIIQLSLSTPLCTEKLTSPLDVWQMSDKVHTYHAFQQIQISNAHCYSKKFIVNCCSLLALDGMDTHCWTSSVYIADWDQESHKRKKLAVLWCSVVHKSPGATLGVWQKRVQQPIILTNRSGCCSSPRDCRCCGHHHHQ